MIRRFHRDIVAVVEHIHGVISVGTVLFPDNFIKDIHQGVIFQSALFDPVEQLPHSSGCHLFFRERITLQIDVGFGKRNGFRQCQIFLFVCRGQFQEIRVKSSVHISVTVHISSRDPGHGRSFYCHTPGQFQHIFSVNPHSFSLRLILCKYALHHIQHHHQRHRHDAHQRGKYIDRTCICRIPLVKLCHLCDRYRCRGNYCQQADQQDRFCILHRD